MQVFRISSDRKAMMRSTTKYLVVLAGLAAAGIIPLAAQAQEQLRPDKQTIDQLLQRLAEAESRIKALESKLVPAAPAASQTLAAVPSAPAPDAPADPETARMIAEAAAEMNHSGHGASGPVGGGLKIRGFSDFTYRASDQKATTNSFTLGQFDLFMTSRLSDKWDFLAESVVQADQATNSFGFEIERLTITYHENDFFNVAMGRYHQKIGYYNTAYHHGSFFQTSVGRPFLFQFEDGGGILPIHNVGISAYGKVPSGKLGLNYVVEVGNGRTSHDPKAEYVQNVLDENNRKSVNVALFARPEFLEGVEIGGSVLKDRLYPDSNSRMGQTISNAYIAYDRNGIEFLNEAILVSNRLTGTGTIHTPAFYSQVSKRYHALRPFARYEYMNVNHNDPIFGSIGRRSGPLFGVRWSVGEFSALKLQYDRTYQTGLGTTNGVTGQVSFAF